MSLIFKLCLLYISAVVFRISFFKELYFFKIYVCGCIASMCVCVLCMPDSQGDQKRVLNSLGLELPTVVRHCMVAFKILTKCKD